MVVAPFRRDGQLDRVLATLFLVINSIVAINAILHDPGVQYDADGHEAYVQSLARLRLPTPDESTEFFLPPLPYVFPALLHRAGLHLSLALKLAQILNVGLSLGITYLLVRILHIPQANDRLPAYALLFLGMLPVYYRTMSYVRGEPFVLFFALLSVHLTIAVLVRKRVSPIHGVALGVSLGCLGLSRQWGLLMFPPLAAVAAIQIFRHGRPRKQYAVACATACLVALAMLAPYYLSLQARFGTVLAFNREPAPQFALTNQPSDFYLGLGLEDLFTAPVRPHFANQLVPILYSDTWGDYWWYFLIYGKEGSQLRSGLRLFDSVNSPVQHSLETNRSDIGPYLGRMNLMGLVPTTVLVASIFLSAGGAVRWWRGGSYRDMLAALSLTVVLASLAGYCWFLIRFPSLETGDTIKAIYIVHTAPFLAAMAAIGINTVRQRWPRLYVIVMVLLIAVFIHATPAFLTRYTPFR